MTASTATAHRLVKLRPQLPTGPGGPWRKVPARVWQAYQSGNESSGWDAWRAHLASRSLRPIGRLTAAKGSPLAWALPSGDEYSQAARLIESLVALEKRPKRRPAGIHAEASRWVGGADMKLPSVAFGLECLAWTRALVPLAAHLEEPAWWNLLERLVAIATKNPSTFDNPLAHQLLSGELPLALAYQFPELAHCSALAEPGRSTITAIMRRVLDGRGVPQARHLPSLSPLLASWTRSKAIGLRLSGGWCARQVTCQYPAVVKNSLRLLGPDRTTAFAAAGATAWPPEFLQTATDLSGSEVKRLGQAHKAGGPRMKRLPSPSVESEQAGVALLRADWSRQSPRLAVAYGDARVDVELCAGAACLAAGAWEFEVRLNGEPLVPIDDWEQTCWISDAKVDYLELELTLSGEVSLERHFVLLKKHRVLLMADAVMGIGHSTIEHLGRLPLAAGTRFQAEAETREGVLVAGGKPRARVLPLALNEWRTATARGHLKACAEYLELAQSTEGECLFAPLFFDLEGARLPRETTWRQLTVAEDREIVPADVAVGYRVQSAKSQWLVYRSLAPPAVRSVLAKNLLHEFLLGEIRPSGQVDTLVEIDNT